MEIQDIQSTEVRKSLADMLNRVAFSDAQYRINRHDKQLARLVPEKLMVAFETLLSGDDTLSETLELMLSDDLRRHIDQAMSQAEAGQAVPLESILES